MSSRNSEALYCCSKFFSLSLMWHFVRQVNEQEDSVLLILNKCKKNCSLSTTYNGEMAHRKPQNNERWYHFRSML